MAAVPSSSIIPYEEKKSPRSTVQNYVNDIVPPLDFSFCKIATVDECETEEPRNASPRKTQPCKKKTDDTGDEKSQSMCLRLHSNELKDVGNIMTVATNLFENANNLGWIDLSFNSIAHIDPVLTQFENLKILYLHGNNITTLKEVDKLSTLSKLWKLTLHGNPIEEIKGYRSYCLAALPKLTSFDFSRVTKGDRVTANTLKSFNTPKPKKINRDDD